MQKTQNLEQRLTNIETLLLSSKVVLTFDEVAVYTGLSKSYLYKLTSTGKVPHYKPSGKIIYFDKKEIDNWLLSNRRVTTKEIDRKAATYCTTKEIGGVK